MVIYYIMDKVRADKAATARYDNIAKFHHGPTKQTLAAFKQHHLERNSYSDEGSLQLFEKSSLKSTAKLFFFRRVLFYHSDIVQIFSIANC